MAGHVAAAGAPHSDRASREGSAAQGLPELSTWVCVCVCVLSVSLSFVTGHEAEEAQEWYRERLLVAHCRWNPSSS